MHCRNCGNPMDDKAVVCTQCGVAKGTGNAFCPSCGQGVDAMASSCGRCGTPLVQPYGGQQSTQGPVVGEQKSRLVAGLLGIFIGSLGIHNFYLGFTNRAILQIVLTVVTCGAAGLWGFIEGILILCKSTITKDANGVPLGD